MNGLVSRKRFLDLLLGVGSIGVAFVTTWPLVRYVNPPKRTSESGDWIDAGTLDEVKLAGFKDILGTTGVPLILVAAEDNVVALEKKCPHLGCMVALQSSELVCPCHGARFTLNGQLISGPAPRGLKQFQVEIRPDGHVFVGKEVS